MKSKYTTIPRGMLCNPGTQILVPVTAKGGPGKSSTIEVCRLLGLPFNAAGYEQPNSRERSRAKGIRK